MKINKLIHIVLAINIGVLCFALMACSSSKMNLVDEYYIYSPDEFHETYYLKCKLSGDRDHEIDSLHTVYWNDSPSFWDEVKVRRTGGLSKRQVLT